MAQFLPRFGAVFLFIGIVASAAQAQQDRETLGVSRVFTNDRFAGTEDRWRSGAFGVSAFRGPGWAGELPLQPFEIMEYRFRGEAITPDNLTVPAPGDRLYAGTWWLGAHTHFGWQGFEVAAGADIAITGEQSGIRSLQASIHDLLSMPAIGLEFYQVENGVYLHGTVEVARSLRWDAGEFRPFVELQAGVETMARAGFDLTFGGLGQGGLRARDPITGQRVAAIVGDDAIGGWSALFGADTAWVDSSIFLPESAGFLAEDSRHRIRAGVNYGVGESNFFYGVTYLSEEFVGQPEGQMVGSISIDIRF
jgi:hypothetical protein